MKDAIKSDIAIREAAPSDNQELHKLLNEIINFGGTTAIETPLRPDEFADYFLRGVNHICCHVAIDGLGVLLGFQALERHAELPNDWADIATFSRLKPKVTGVGTALFAMTKLRANQLGVSAINATIRADNQVGLIYYEKMGFKTYSVNHGISLNDGTTIDRISKRFLVC